MKHNNHSPIAANPNDTGRSQAHAVRWAVFEALTNLRRNVTITVAAIATAAVSLTLVGAALVGRDAVGNATQRWSGGVEFIVYMNPDAAKAEITKMGDRLKGDTGISKVRYVDRNEAFDEFKALFQAQPEIVETVTPDLLPTSYRIVPKKADSDAVLEVANKYRGDDGVYAVVTAADTVKRVQRIAGIASGAALFVAVVLAGCAAMLTGNTIRMATYARRKEIEVMALVGASPWIIRGPFVAEGTIAGIVGGLVASGFTYGASKLVGRLGGSAGFRLLEGFGVTGLQTFKAAFIVAVLGALMGAAASAAALRRHLKV